MLAGSPRPRSSGDGVAVDPRVGEVAVLGEVRERALLHARELVRIEDAVAVGVVLLDHVGAEELVELPAMAQADQPRPLEQEGRDAGDPDVRMGRSGPALERAGRSPDRTASRRIAGMRTRHRHRPASSASRRSAGAVILAIGNLETIVSRRPACVSPVTRVEAVDAARRRAPRAAGNTARARPRAPAPSGSSTPLRAPRALDHGLDQRRLELRLGEHAGGVQLLQPRADLAAAAARRAAASGRW